MSYASSYTLKSGIRRIFLLSFASGLVFATGCGVSDMASTDITSTVATSGGGIIGKLHGGQQPISNATVSLYTIGAAGYGSAATKLASVTTDVNGNFSFGSYTCSGTLAYLVASGGNAQGSTTQTNSNIKMMAVLGGPTPAASGSPVTEGDLCSNLTSSTQVVINEVSTVVAIYELAQYFNPSTESLGVSSTSGSSLSYVGITNGVNNVASIVTPANGWVNPTYTPYGLAYPYPATNNYQVVGTPESDKIYLIADIIAACINSSGPTSTPCVSLFAAAAPPPTGVTTTLLSKGVITSYPSATDTLQAAYYMAVNPTNATVAGTPNAANMTALFTLASSTPPFATAITTQPTDWTISVGFGSSAYCSDASCASYIISGPTSLAVDSQGDIFFISNTSNTLTVFTTLMPYGGEAMSRYAGNSPFIGFGLDSGETITNGSGAEFDVMYAKVTTSSCTTCRQTYNSGLNYVYTPGTTIALFVDTNATTVGIDGISFAGDATKMYFPVVTNGYVYSTLNVLQSGSAFSANNTTVVTTLTAINNGHPITGFTAPTGTSTMKSPATAIAMDRAATPNVWVTAPGGNSVYAMPASGSGVTPTAYTTGLNAPTGIAIDHSNNAWVVNSAGGTPANGYVAEITAAGTIVPDLVAGHGGINNPAAIAVDGVGNIWVANAAGGSAGTGSVSEFALVSGALTALSSSVGFEHFFNAPGVGSIAVDLSGNVWVGNSGQIGSTATHPGITMILGAAAPTLQQLSYAVKQNEIASLP